MGKGKVRVVYIAGVGRSGSTLLGRVLSQDEGVVFVGEARALPSQINSKCGCGQTVRKCRFWSRILDTVNVDAVRQARNKFRVRDLLFGYPQVNLPLSQLVQFYRAIQRESGARVIVDSSKFPSYLLCLSESTEIDVRVLHLVRDPRAIAHSWWKRPIRENKQDVPVLERSCKSLKYENPIRSSLIWVLWNSVIEKNWSQKGYFYRLKYEDFCSNPKNESSRAMSMLCLEESINWVNSRKICLDTQHSIRGNPNRFEGGITQVKERSEWETSLSTATKLLVSGLTSPLLRRYGYTFTDAWFGTEPTGK